MPKKKRPDIQELLDRPWCYYCERDFDDLKILISHQRAKHFKCERCGNRLSTAGGLSVHLSQVHKATLSSVENALPNRASLDVEIFGMEGIPEDIVQQHRQRVLSQFDQAELERRISSGNSANGPSKKLKLESPSDLKKRLAEHKAKRAAQEAGGSSGGATPDSTVQALQSPASGENPGPYVSVPPTARYSSGLTYKLQSQQQQQPPQVLPQYLPRQGSPLQPSFPPPFPQPGYPYSQHQPQFPQQPPLYGQGLPGHPFPGAPPFLPPNPAYSPPSQQNGGPFPPPHASGIVPPPYAIPQPQPMQQPSPVAQPLATAPRSAGLPPAPGLPQRPAFAAPAVNTYQLQQMHQTSQPGISPQGQDVSHDPRVRAMNGQAKPSLAGQTNADQHPQQQLSAAAVSVDELIASAAQGAHSNDPKSTEALPATPVEPSAEKKSKKDKEKDKATKLVYSDNDVSPEEKMAKLPRYAFSPDKKNNTVLGDAVHATVTGVVDEQNESMAVAAA